VDHFALLMNCLEEIIGKLLVHIVDECKPEQAALEGLGKPFVNGFTLLASSNNYRLVCDF